MKTEKICRLVMLSYLFICLIGLILGCRPSAEENFAEGKGSHEDSIKMKDYLNPDSIIIVKIKH